MDTQKIRHFRKTLREFERVTNVQLKSCCNEVSMAQCHVLLEIESGGQTTTEQLARRLGLDRSTISRTIDGLVNIELVDRLPHPSDRRFTLLTLTEQGQSICDAINRSSDRYYTQILEKIPDDKRDIVIESLARLVQAFIGYENSINTESECFEPIAMNSKNYFEEMAGQWDTLRSDFYSENVCKKALDIANLQPGKLAADIGAGTGFLTEELIARGVRVIAVDQSAAMLRVLRSKLSSSSQVDCRLGDAENLPIEDNAVDYAFANMYLHHVESPPLAIKEMARILRPGGALIIADMDEHEFDFLRTEQHDHWMGFKREDVKHWFIDAGLKDVHIECVGENCCAESKNRREKASVSIFIASGKKQKIPYD